MATYHLMDDDLEAYSLGRLSPAASDPLEEHLVGCTGCQDRLAAWDEYLRAIRAACRAVGTPSRARTAGHSLPK